MRVIFAHLNPQIRRRWQSHLRKKAPLSSDFDKNAGAFSSKSTFPQGKVLVGMYVNVCAPINNISHII